MFRQRRYHASVRTVGFCGRWIVWRWHIHWHSAPMLIILCGRVHVDGHILWLSRTRYGVVTCLVRCFGTGFLVSKSADEFGVVGGGVRGALVAADEEETEGEEGEEGEDTDDDAGDGAA
jgi:hypothetical protein